MAKKRLIFVVDDEQDLDILSWWVRQDNKSAAVRTLIRREISQDGVTLGDIYEAVMVVDRKLTSGVKMVDHDVNDSAFDEPDDVAAALDNLGL